MATPINLLPSELLARIFSEAACNCERESYPGFPPYILSPISLSGVCQYWRQVAVAHQLLWTHIDLGVDIVASNGRYHSPGIWIERSKCAPLYLSIFQFYFEGECQSEEEEDPDAVPLNSEQGLAPTTRRLIDFISPLMPQVCSLTTFLPYPNSCTRAILDSWTKNGTLGQAKSLTVRTNPDLIESRIRSSDSYRSFFEPLEALHLGNTVLSWHNFDFKNLIILEIELEEGSWTVALSEFVAVVASCPRLQDLALYGLHIELPFVQKPEPVLLSQLHVLRVGGFDFREDGATMLESILGVINPGQNTLSMKVSLLGLHRFIQQALDGIRSFINRTNVATLWVTGCELPILPDSQYYASQFGPLPRVQTLILENWYFYDVLEFYHARQPNPELIFWPHVQNLYLHHCRLEQAYLPQLFSVHSIQNLYMQQCMGKDSSQPTIASDNKPELSEGYAPLSTFVPTVVHLPGTLSDWPLLLTRAGLYF
ncbi:hypothetical protein FRC08_009561 [Ceratobasidium sp. 394]|nr:hypothetical protein FRC08_009561 [Ceratobasidium sp. 394]KAG9079602.1 hypothetical protein FS749_008380 [Ceratobasidium sp. UAMH 11750]